MKKDYDFCGWATKNNIKCSDGRVIMKDAFIDNDGMKVPLVWNHQHNDPSNVLGHALLKNEQDGVLAYCYFNNTSNGQDAKMMVQHGDIASLSIFANKIIQKGNVVEHGKIVEVSLVLAGANPGASIVDIRHSDDDIDGYAEEAILYPSIEISLNHAEEETQTTSEELKMADNSTEVKTEQEKTVQDVIDGFTEDQRIVVNHLIETAVDEALKVKNDKTVEHSDDDKATETERSDSETEKNKESEEDNTMKHNVFNNNQDTKEQVLSHAEEQAIFADIETYGSLKKSMLKHGITNIANFYGEDHLIGDPTFVKRPDTWVTKLMDAVHKFPFAKVKALFLDLTADDARAKGYVKGNQKAEEVVVALKRTTQPQTVYKKQKIDRDDLIDITDFNAAALIQTEMKGMLQEELARAILVGDGRNPLSDDKIKEDCIVPVYKDTSVYTIQATADYQESDTDAVKADAIVRAVLLARKNYKGSGNPTFYTSEDVMAIFLLAKDLNGRYIYEDEGKVAKVLRAKEVVVSPCLENVAGSTEGSVLVGLFFNPDDYAIGRDRGGQVSMFDDFDIDYNAQKYLIETRVSGALIKPYSAIAVTKLADTEGAEG